MAKTRRFVAVYRISSDSSGSLDSLRIQSALRTICRAPGRLHFFCRQVCRPRDCETQGASSLRPRISFSLIKHSLAAGPPFRFCHSIAETAAMAYGGKLTDVPAV